MLARYVLERQHPDYNWVLVDAEMVLDAGFDVPGQRVRPRSRRGTNMRGDYFLLGHKGDGIRSRTRLVVLECKGTHSDDYAVDQLGKAAYQLNSMLVRGRTPPGLMIATVLGPKHIVAKILDPEGEGDLWAGETGRTG